VSYFFCNLKVNHNPSIEGVINNWNGNKTHNAVRTTS